MTETGKLTPEQQKAISEIDGNLQIIACAGSGKTEVITRRIANILQSKPDIKPENIVAFTFTKKAATSMKARIAKALGEASGQNISRMYIGTIHSFCYHLLNQCTEQFREYRILDTVKSHLFVSRYANECGMSDLELELYPRNVNLFLQCIDKMIDDYDNADTWTQKQRDVLNKYIDCLYSHGYIDFSLMIFETLRQIAQNAEVKEYLSHIKYLIVDEYQDVNDLQEKLIQRIAETGANICVVGDDDQTIYQFRGSNANNIISFSERYANVHQVRLEKNFRCAPGIVDVADCVIGHNKRRISKKMISGVPKLAAEITAARYSDKSEEYDAIAKKIKELHESGIPYNEMAVLVRKGKVIAPVSTALERADIPYETDSAEHFFGGNYFGRFVTTLQILVDVDKARLYECWRDVANGAAFNMGFKYLRSCARGGNLPLSTIIRGFCEKIAFLEEDTEDIESRKIDLEGIEKILDDYDEIYGDWQLSARINGVLKFLGSQAADEYKYHSFKPNNPEADAVQIMTVHKAKGLEFHTVFLPELMKREFPVSNMGGKQYWHVLGGVFEANKDKYQSDLEDERKLFYVAVTRAKQNLYMTYELSAQPVSCFVSESSMSRYLKINRDDLTYNPKAEKDDFNPRAHSAFETSRCDPNPEWVEERSQRQEYWAAVKYAKSQLYDYYGTGAHFCPAMYTMLEEIKKWSPDQILSEASRNGLI
jgi:DNA helicase-2/ATP-dependent DNA helicase PcrA